MSNLDIKFTRLTPFKRCVLQNFPFIEEDFDALTNYGLLCKVVEYLNKVIDSQNNVLGVTEEIVTAFNDLYDYVKNYFDNLDVQEEINNKLDEMAEDGTLSNIINNYDKCIFSFGKFLANAKSGDANLIINQNKSILIDTENAEYYSTLVDRLNHYNVTHLDVVVITHYHADHIGNFKSLVTNGYIDSETKLFMPAETTQFGYGAAIAEYKAYCEENNLQYYVPDEGEIYSIGNITLEFTNCDGAALDAYYPAGTGSQNAVSTIVKVKHKEVVALYTGDAVEKTYQRLYELNFVNEDVELHKIGHHGIATTTYKPFFNSYNAKYGVLVGGILDFAKNNFGLGAETTILERNGSKIYPTYMQNEYLEFVSDGYNLFCSQGRPYRSAEGRIANTYYVDITASKNTIQDGSSAHPFSEIMQAISNAPNSTNEFLNIILAPGTYCLSHEDTSGSKNRLTIDDKKITISNDGTQSAANYIINGINIHNAYLRINGCKIVTDYYNIQTTDSTLILRDCIVSRIDQTNPTTEGDMINSNGGSLFISDTRIEYGYVGINVYNGGYVVTRNLTVGSMTTNTYLQRVDHNTIIFEYGTQFDNNDTAKYANAIRFGRYANKVLLYSTDSTEYSSETINLNAPIAKFFALVFVTWNARSKIETHYKIINGNDTNQIYLESESHNANTLIKAAIIATASGSTITLSSPATFYLNRSANTWTNDSTQNIRIMKVYGIGEEQFTDLTSPAE